MSHIAPTAEKNINADERAVIETYDFDLYDDVGGFKLIDNVIRKFDKTAGQYSGSKMQTILNAAIAARKAHVGANPVAATPTPAPANTPKDAAHKAGNGKAKGKANAAPAPAKAETPPAKVVVPAKEITGAELDNTGKREKKSKRVTKDRVKKENRYKRAAKAILANPTIDAKALAKAADFSGSAAIYCLEAFTGITEALVEAKLMKPLAAPTKTLTTSGK